MNMITNFHHINNETNTMNMANEAAKNKQAVLGKCLTFSKLKLKQFQFCQDALQIFSTKLSVQENNFASFTSALAANVDRSASKLQEFNIIDTEQSERFSKDNILSQGKFIFMYTFRLVNVCTRHSSLYILHSSVLTAISFSTLYTPHSHSFLQPITARTFIEVVEKAIEADIVVHESLDTSVTSMDKMVADLHELALRLNTSADNMEEQIVEHTTTIQQHEQDTTLSTQKTTEYFQKIASARQHLKELADTTAKTFALQRETQQKQASHATVVEDLKDRMARHLSEQTLLETLQQQTAHVEHELKEQKETTAVMETSLRDLESATKEKRDKVTDLSSALQQASATDDKVKDRLQHAISCAASLTHFKALLQTEQELGQTIRTANQKLENLLNANQLEDRRIEQTLATKNEAMLQSLARREALQLTIRNDLQQMLEDKQRLASAAHLKCQQMQNNQMRSIDEFDSSELFSLMKQYEKEKNEVDQSASHAKGIVTKLTRNNEAGRQILMTKRKMLQKLQETELKVTKVTKVTKAANAAHTANAVNATKDAEIALRKVHKAQEVAASLGGLPQGRRRQRRQKDSKKDRQRRRKKDTSSDSSNNDMLPHSKSEPLYGESTFSSSSAANANAKSKPKKSKPLSQPPRKSKQHDRHQHTANGQLGANNAQRKKKSRKMKRMRFQVKSDGNQSDDPFAYPASSTEKFQRKSKSRRRTTKR